MEVKNAVVKSPARVCMIRQIGYIPNKNYDITGVELVRRLTRE